MSLGQRLRLRSCSNDTRHLDKVDAHLGMLVRMSESPASRTVRTQTRCRRPEAVPIGALEAGALTELNVVSFEVADLGLSEHGHVFELGLADGRAVVRDDDQLGRSVSEASEGKLVT